MRTPSDPPLLSEQRGDHARGKSILRFGLLLLVYIAGIIPAAVLGILVAATVFELSEPAYALGMLFSVPAWLILFPMLIAFIRR